MVYKNNLSQNIFAIRPFVSLGQTPLNKNHTRFMKETMEISQQNRTYIKSYDISGIYGRKHCKMCCYGVLLCGDIT